MADPISFCVPASELDLARSWLQPFSGSSPIDYQAPNGPAYQLDTCLSDSRNATLARLLAGGPTPGQETNLRSHGFNKLNLAMRREDAIAAASRQLDALASRPPTDFVNENIFSDTAAYWQAVSVKQWQLSQLTTSPVAVVVVESFWGIFE